MRRSGQPLQCCANGRVEPRDWIAELNKIAAAEVHRAWMMQGRKQWPRDLVGGESRPGSMQIDGKLRDAILDAELLAMPSHAEPLSGDGFRLEFYDDGYPKLPECLRRRRGIMKRIKNLDVAGTSHDPEIGCTKGIQGEFAPAPHLYSLCASAAQPNQQPEHRRQRRYRVGGTKYITVAQAPTSSRRSDLQNRSAFPWLPISRSTGPTQT